MSKRKKIVVAIAVFILVALSGVAIWRYAKLSSAEKSNKEVFESTKKMEVAPSGLDPSQSLLLMRYINEGKYNEARVLVDELLAQSNLQERDKQGLNASKQIVCLKQQDLVCLEKSINDQKSTNSIDIYFVLDTAKVAEAKGNTALAKKFYRIAKTELDAKGGSAYADTLNKTSDSTIIYAEVANGAK